MTQGIREFLIEHELSRPVSFHMPGHKGYDFFERNGFGEAVKRLASWDITEIYGADNLFQPETVIRKTMEKYESLYGAKKSYLLVNGSSSGIIASVLASVPKGGKLIMARNCHKSVFNALRLGDIEPVYAFPYMEEKYGISGEILTTEIERCMEENPDASAVIIPSPNYYGICSDIEEISRRVHERGGVLIVDQAHGAHLKFFRDIGNNTASEAVTIPRAAEELGADAVINSTHKTLASFTQTAVLNICSDRIDTNSIEDKLQIMESSSPSYPLMATLDINADILEACGRKLAEEWLENVRWFYNEAVKIEGLALMKSVMLDYTKLNIDMSRIGCDGACLEKFLIGRGIFPELVSGDIVMCMTGIGNTRRDYERLIEALSDLSWLGGKTCGFDGKDLSSGSCGSLEIGAGGGSLKEFATKNKIVSLPSRLELGDIPKEKELVHIEEAAGRVCAAAVIPYPPGIPLVCPGEVFTREITDYVKKQREAGEKVVGVDEALCVWVGKQRIPGRG